MASPKSPYAVYGTTFGGSAYCGTVMSVAPNGTLSNVEQDYVYSTSSGVHGLALSPDQRFLYSADDSGNAVWTHRVNQTTGALTYVAKLPGPATGADPRHVAVHPSGKYMYVVLEGSNELGIYEIDVATGIPTFTNTTYPLIPEGISNSAYWSDEVAFALSGTFLWATSRARSTNSTGYISTISLSPDGAPVRQLLLEPTASGGGTANSIAPAFFSDEWAALTDSSVGFVQVWRAAANGSSAKAVATVQINDGGCCANAIWYD
ncbi:3-carboxy-cis,cis-mucoante lactonizing enzyme [Glonium stellatum]|uniref:3-carboxy-cis,cis-mucoante lactonizing enzyme n=1 Tax=Glonium stellatum TaxID=574774 RepID=A0A8E2F061_9PEZI|nr:3-carboxy-cis,cis-mucoante lactonizing enzyme [Glonium stellatum]